MKWPLVNTFQTQVFNFAIAYLCIIKTIERCIQEFPEGDKQHMLRNIRITGLLSIKVFGQVYQGVLCKWANEASRLVQSLTTIISKQWPLAKTFQTQVFHCAIAYLCITKMIEVHSGISGRWQTTYRMLRNIRITGLLSVKVFGPMYQGVLCKWANEASPLVQSLTTVWLAVTSCEHIPNAGVSLCNNITNIIDMIEAHSGISGRWQTTVVAQLSCEVALSLLGKRIRVYYANELTKHHHHWCKV